MFTMMLVTAVSDIGALMLEIGSFIIFRFWGTTSDTGWGAMLNEGRTYNAKLRGL